MAYTFDKVKENSFVPDYGVDERDFVNENGEIYAQSRNVVKSLMNRHTTFIADLHFFYNPLRDISHNLTLTGGFRYQYDTYVNSYGEGHNTSSDFINDLGNTSSSLHFTSGKDLEWRNMAWYLSGEYAWLQRYILGVDATREQLPLRKERSRCSAYRRRGVGLLPLGDRSVAHDIRKVDAGSEFPRPAQTSREP